MARLSHKAEQAIQAHNHFKSDCADRNMLKYLEREREVCGLIGKRTLWCSDCGQVISMSREDFAAVRAQYEGAGEQYGKNARATMTCPHCGRRMVLTDISCKHTVHYYQQLVKMGEYQAIRMWLVEQRFHRGQAAQVEMYHVYDELWNDRGDCYLFSRRISCCNAYYCYNPFSDDPTLHYRTNHGQFHYGWHVVSYIIHSMCDWARKRELQREHCGIIDRQRAFAKVLNGDAFAETLWKSDNPILYDYATSGERVKAAIKVAYRHSWQQFGSVWLDYIRSLIELGKDVHNPALIMPADLDAAHDKAMAQVERKREREYALRQASLVDEEVKKYTDKYERFISKYIGLVIVAKDVEIRPLPDVRSFYDEGTAMHHCVWSRGYYKKPHCLILSARVDGKRKETIEIDTKNWRALQIFGKCNGESDRHKEIVAAVNNWCEEQKRNNRRVHA